MKRLEPVEDLEFAWPEIIEPGDPWAGDDHLCLPAELENAASFAPQCDLDEHSFAALDLEFEATLREVVAGRLPRSALDPLADRLGLVGPRRHDLRPMMSSPLQVSNNLLADISENMVPDIGQVGPDRVLGPLADLPVAPSMRVLTAAVLAFAPVGRLGQSPIERLARLRPHPPLDLRRSLVAIDRCPPCLWQVVGDRLRPMLPLRETFAPDVPVAGLPAVPAVIGRLVLGPHGAWLACALALPALPPRSALAARMDLEQTRLRRYERRATWEDTLRVRGEVLYRSACEWTVLEDLCLPV
jgi:hypothetical protein